LNQFARSEPTPCLKRERFQSYREVDGRPLVAMIDMGLRGMPDKQGLSFFLSLSTSLIGPTSEGLPTRSDADNLNIWEDTVEERLQSAGKFVFVGRVTWNGNRELLYYVGNQHSTLETLKIMSDVHSTRPFAFICEPDDEWERVGVWLNRH
jgi:hypothetical protein